MDTTYGPHNIIASYTSCPVCKSISPVLHDEGGIDIMDSRSFLNELIQECNHTVRLAEVWYESQGGITSPQIRHHEWTPKERKAHETKDPRTT